MPVTIVCRSRWPVWQRQAGGGCADGGLWSFVSAQADCSRPCQKLALNPGKLLYGCGGGPMVRQLGGHMFACACVPAGHAARRADEPALVRRDANMNAAGTAHIR